MSEAEHPAPLEAEVAHDEARDDAGDGVRDQLATLEASLARCEAERDRAILARDAVIKQVLPASPAAKTAPRRRSLLSLLLIFALGSGAMLLLYRMTLKAKEVDSILGQRRGRQRRGKTILPKIHARKPAPSFRSRRISVIPITGLEALGRAALSADGQTLALAGRGGLLALYSLARDRLLLKRRVDRLGIRDVVFGPAGKSVITGGEDGAVKVFGIDGRQLRLLRPSGTAVRDLAVSQASLIVGAEQPAPELISLRGGRRIMLAPHRGWVRAVASTPDGQVFATGGNGGVIHLYRQGQTTPLRRIEAHRQWINALALSADGAKIASAAFDKRIRVWEVKTGAIIYRFRGHHRRVMTLAFNQGGNLLVSAGLDRRALVWDLLLGRRRYLLAGHRWAVFSAAFDAAGRFVYTASGDGTLRLWPIPLPLPPMDQLLGPPAAGELTLRSNTTGARLRLKVVGAKGEILPAALTQLARFLRSGPDDRQLRPDAKLIELLYRVCSHFGRAREILVISGYRSKEFNALRTRQSREVAKASKHITGQAIDFRLEGVTIGALHKFVLALKAGGVGFYADSQFVHMDTGPVRSWSGH